MIKQINNHYYYTDTELTGFKYLPVKYNYRTATRKEKEMVTFGPLGRALLDGFCGNINLCSMRRKQL